MASDRKLIVEIIGDDRSLSRTFKSSERGAKDFDRRMTQTFRGVAAGSGAFRAIGRQVAFASGAFLGAAGFTAVAKEAIGVASNLTEQANKVNVVFGSSGAAVRRWATTTATSIGIANDQALEAAGIFGNLFRTVGLAPARNAELSRSLVKLAADMASFNNADPSEVLDALRSGLIGEAEPLRRFGVLLSETRVQQEAMRETGKKTAAQLTAQEKVIARYNLILRDTAPAQGDFARTQNGLANASRQLRAEIRDTEGAIAKTLLPTVRRIAVALRDWLAQPKNQKKIQDDAKTSAEILTQAMGALADAYTVAAAAAKQYNEFSKQAGKSPGPLGTLFKVLFQPGFGLSQLAKALSGGGGGQGIPGLTGPVGPRQQPSGRRPPGLTGPIDGRQDGRTGGGRLSFQGHFNQLENRLAAALTRAGQAEDRAILVQEQHLLKRWIAQTKDWQKRRELYDQLARVQSDIKSIDDDRRQKEQDVRDKELAARRKEREKALEHARKLKAAAKEAAAKLKEAADAVRDQLAPIFGGPVLDPIAEATKGILGVKGPTIGTITSDIKAGTKQALGFFNDLAKIRRRGANSATVAELRAGGVQNAALVHIIATASGAQFKQFLAATAKRERVVQQIAHAEVRAKSVTVVANDVRFSRSTPATQRRGRQAGVQALQNVSGY